MSLQDKAKAIAKNIEGKLQEAVGDLTGDPKAQAEGKEKQAEAKIRHDIEEVKDEVKKTINANQDDTIEIAVSQDQKGTELYDSPTPDSYDPHIVPAETAVRKELEGDDFKHLAEHPEGSESIDTTGGFTVDKEGLVDNFAIEPEMYSENPGDLQESSNSASMTNKYTIVDTFPSPTEAESVVLKMKKAGLDTHKISIIGKDYQNTDRVNGSLNWKDIAESGGLEVVLTALGISKNEALKYETEIESGKFVVLVMGSDEDITQAHQILHNIGHRINEASIV